MFTWVQQLADGLVYELLGLAPSSRLGTALNFFVYDTIKILLLLFLITLLMGVVNAYFPVERLRAFLASRRFYGADHLLAALFGAVTPFCSCSSVPLFIGFVRGGIPLGVTFSFLITSPLVNEVALAVFLGMFGWKVTLIYAGTGVLLGTVGGFVLGRLRLERMLSEWVRQLWEQTERQPAEFTADRQSLRVRLPGITREAWGIVRGVLPYVLVGIGAGAAMHGYVPENFFATYLHDGQWWTVPLAVVLAVPMYANAAGILPVIQVFVAKGIPLGTAIAFMMATVGLSLPEATLLRKVMTVRLIGVYFGVVTLFIIASGYLFNQVL